MTQPISLELLPRTAAIDAKGHMSIGGCDLQALAQQFGTPLFVYDETEIRERCREYIDTFRGSVAYASKAFLCTALVHIVAEEGLDIDVASGGELNVALAAGMPAQRIVLHGNNKSSAELRQAMMAGIKHIVVDSFDELDRIHELVNVDGLSRPSVLVRVNPGVDAHTHEYLATGAVDSKFGFALLDGVALRAIERIVSDGSTQLGGLHIHIGSQIFARDGFTAAIDRLVAFIAQIERATGVTIEELNLGGGLGVRYTLDDAGIDIGNHSAMMQEDLGSALAAVGARSAPRLATEPGRSIVATAGVTLYSVGTIKAVPGGRTYVSVDGGMSDNSRPAMYGARYEAFVVTRAADTRGFVATVAGKHCEQGDLLVRDAQLPADISIGDVLCTPCTGAYGYSMASNYNKLARPAVVFVADGVARVVVRRETDEDLQRLDVG